MNRFIKSLFCLCLCGFLLSGCSFDISGINSAVDAVAPIKLTGELETKTFLPSNGFAGRKLEFENISVSSKDNKAKIYIIPSDETKVEVTYPSDILDYGFRVYYQEGEIEISVPKQTNFIAEAFQVFVYANIEEIDISGGVALEMNAADSRKIDIDVKGAAAIYIYNIAAESVEAEIAGAADVNLSGTADYFDMELKGAGAIDAKNLICKKTEVRISGAGSASVSVTDELMADVDGVGALEYYGDPIIKNISGGLTDVEQVSKEVYGG